MLKNITFSAEEELILKAREKASGRKDNIKCCFSKDG
jgi:hypothetical protein